MASTRSCDKEYPLFDWWQPHAAHSTRKVQECSGNFRYILKRPRGFLYGRFYVSLRCPRPILLSGRRFQPTTQSQTTAQGWRRPSASPSVQQSGTETDPLRKRVHHDLSVQTVETTESYVLIRVRSETRIPSGHGDRTTLAAGSERFTLSDADGTTLAQEQSRAAHSATVRSAGFSTWHSRRIANSTSALRLRSIR